MTINRFAMPSAASFGLAVTGVSPSPPAEAFLESGDLRNTDCTVLDIRMPGLSGLELQRRLRDMRCSIPIIFATGHADEFLDVRALKEGAVAFLSKPFSGEALLGAIRSALDSSEN